jgi:Fe-S oxidoreductase
MYGPSVMAAMAEFKRIWDPEQRMNPGRIIEPLARTDDLKHADYHPEPPPTTFAFPEDDGDFTRAAARCIGIGECRRMGGGVMCPSYMVTKDERHSTRGRARVLYEMLAGEVITDGWTSEAVHEALDLCLACKGCKRECPVHVDMATYKAEFMAHRYRSKRRPRQAYALGWIHRWARLGAALPRLANLATQTPGLATLAKAIAGVARERELPRLATRSFRREFARRRRPDWVVGRKLLLWPDTFNDTFFPEVLHAAVQVLEHAGFVVTIPARRLCCGRALYDFGMLDLAKRLWTETLDALALDIATGTPVVGLEPSCVAAFRDELPNLFPHDLRARRLAAQTKTLAELLGERDELPLERLDARVVVHYHCHQRSIMGTDCDDRLYERLGVNVEVPELGCCGMAGAFGFEPDKLAVSLAAGERHLLPAVREAAAETLVIADGFSCREQIRQLSGRKPLHLAELLVQALTEPIAQLRGATDARR